LGGCDYYKGFYIAPNLSHQLHDSNRANPVADPGWNARGFMGGLWVGAIASDRNSSEELGADCRQ
jgi:hypothetical protein